MARLQDTTARAATSLPIFILVYIGLHACACAYSAIYAWKLWAETLLSPQSGKVPRHVEAELPLPAHPITLRLQAGAGAVLGICRFAIAGSINASHHRDMKHVVIGRAAVAVTTRTR